MQILTTRGRRTCSLAQQGRKGQKQTKHLGDGVSLGKTRVKPVSRSLFERLLDPRPLVSPTQNATIFRRKYIWGSLRITWRHCLPLKNATVDKHLPSLWVVKTYLGIPKVGPRLISDPEATEMRNECEVETLQLEEAVELLGFVLVVDQKIFPQRLEEL